MNENKYVLTTLSENPEYFEETILLIEEEFHYHQDNHFDIDFAPLVHPLNFENCFVIIDQESNQVVAHLSVCERIAVKNGVETPVAIIGGIVTAKKYRGKKFFKTLLNHVLVKFQDKVSLFLLWSEIEGLYEKFSFYRTGGLIETGKTIFQHDQRPIGYERTQFSELSENDFETIVNLYVHFNQNHFFTIKREQKDWSIIRGMSSIDLYIKRNSDHCIEKYFCVNKGRDLTNIIHEISCLGLKEYAQIIKELEVFKLWLPESEQVLSQNKEIFYTAFMKLGDPKELNLFLANVSDGRLEIKVIHDSKVIIIFDNKQFELTEKDFLQSLLGPKPLAEWIDLGLSLYVAGADSI